MGMGKIEQTRLPTKLRQIAEKVRRKLERWRWRAKIVSAANIFGFLLALVGSLWLSVVIWLGLPLLAIAIFAFPLVIAFWAYRLRSFHSLVRQIGSHEEQKRMEALLQLLRRGEEAVPLLLQAFETPEDSAPYGDWNGARAHQYAIEGLGRLKVREAIDEVAKALKSSDASVRATAAWFFGELGIKEAIPNLIPLLADEEKCCVLCGSNKEWVTLVKHVAAEALQRLGEGELVEDFKRVLERERDEEALKQLRRWLPQYRHPIVRGLIKALSNENVFSASRAAWALGKLNAVEALPVLERLANSFRTPHILRQVCKEVVLWLRLIATLPSPADLTSIRTENLPAIPDPNAIPTDTLPRPAIAPDENGEAQSH
jgi:hypothetical protein